MGTIELHLESSKGEQIILKSPYNGIKSGFKNNNLYFVINSGKLKIYFLFKDKKNFNNFSNNLKNYYLKTNNVDLNPEMFKVEIYRESNDKIIEGEYSYLEFLSHGNKPAFFISLNKKEKNSFEIYFYFDVKKELEKLISNLEKIGNIQ